MCFENRCLSNVLTPTFVWLLPPTDQLMVRNHVLWFFGLSLFNRALPANYRHSPASVWLLIARIFTYLRAGAVGGRWTDGGSMVQTSHPREVRQLGKRHRHAHSRAQVTPGHHLTAHTDRHTAVLRSPGDITWRHTQTDIQPGSGHPGHHLTAHTDRHTAVLRSPGDITWRHTQTDIQPGSGHPGHHRISPATCIRIHTWIWE